MDALVGLPITDWLRLLKRNKLAVDRARWGVVLEMGVYALLNSIKRREELRKFGAEIDRQTVQPPVFVLGHWRSGTTLLHTLLSQDEQFAYPNLFQVTHPHTMLVREKIIEKWLGDEEAKNRPMDNVQISFRSPGEDEHALAVLTLLSPEIAWTFPRHEATYDKYLTFREASPAEITYWKEKFLFFMRKLTYRYQKPIILKSPTHTARIRLLLEMFPQARFVHIHRNPFVVFRSTQKLFATAVRDSHLHDPAKDPAEGIIRRYAEMNQAFFEERSLISPGRLIDVSYEDLTLDMVGQVARIYDCLGLGNFARFEPKLSDYVASIQDYQKNSHPALPDELRHRLVNAWQRSFDEWGYSTNLS